VPSSVQKPSTANCAALSGCSERSLLRNGLYNIGGQTVRSLVSLLTIPLLVRFLGIREYGIWSLAYAAFMLMTVGNGGMAVAATVFLPSDLHRDDQSEAGGTLALIVVSAGVLGVLVGWLLWFLGPTLVGSLAAFGPAERIEVARALQIAGLGISLLILHRTLMGVEQAFDRYGAANTFQVLQSVLANGGLVLVAWFGGQAVAMMKWQVVAYAILLAGHGWFISTLVRERHLRIRWNAARARKILKFSLATWASIIGSDLFTQGSRWIVGAVLGAPVLGVYSAITNMTLKINSFSGMATQPLVPSLSRGAVRNAPPDSHVRQAAHVNALIAIGAGTFFFVLADWIMRMMVPGATGTKDVIALQIAVVIFALYSISAPGYFILFSIGDARTNFIVVLSSAIVSLGLIFLGGWRFGLLGAIAGNAAYLGTLLLIPMGLHRIHLSLRRYVAWITFPILILATAILVGVVLKDHVWWRAVFVAATACLLAFWFIRGETALVGEGWIGAIRPDLITRKLTAR
jgi:O-antigen/teichoic acid export membrane protein